MKHFYFYLLISATTLLLLGCMHQQNHMLDGQKSYLRVGVAKSGPLSKEEAIEIAKHEAKNRNELLEFYEEPSVNGPKAGKWFIFFLGKSPCPGCAPALGSHFSISIDENDGTTFYSPGR